MDTEELPTGFKALIGLLTLTAVGSSYFYLNFIRMYGGFDSSTMGMLLGIGTPLLAISSLLGAYGLYKRERWGWTLSINIFALAIGLDLILLLTSQKGASPARTALSAVVVYYMFSNRDVFLSE
jgi:hypothetical protein